MTAHARCPRRPLADPCGERAGSFSTASARLPQVSGRSDRQRVRRGLRACGPRRGRPCDRMRSPDERNESPTGSTRWGRPVRKLPGRPGASRHPELAAQSLQGGLHTRPDPWPGRYKANVSFVSTLSIDGTKGRRLRPCHDHAEVPFDRSRPDPDRCPHAQGRWTRRRSERSNRVITDIAPNRLFGKAWYPKSSPGDATWRQRPGSRLRSASGCGLERTGTTGSSSAGRRLDRMFEVSVFPFRPFRIQAAKRDCCRHCHTVTARL